MAKPSGFFPMNMIFAMKILIIFSTRNNTFINVTIYVIYLSKILCDSTVMGKE